MRNTNQKILPCKTTRAQKWSSRGELSSHSSATLEYPSKNSKKVGSLSDDEDERNNSKKKRKLFAFSSKSKRERNGSGDVKKKSKNKDEFSKDGGQKQRAARSNTISELSVAQVQKRLSEVKPIFGVELEDAVKQSKSLDGIELPLIIRECIDHVEGFGKLTKLMLTNEHTESVHRVQSHHEDQPSSFLPTLHNWEIFFGHVKLKKCKKPLQLDSSGQVQLPDGVEELEEELQFHESLLNKMHEDLNKGVASHGTEEELWEVQRIVTQMKRKLRKAKSVQKQAAPKQQEDDKSDSVDQLSTIPRWTMDRAPVRMRIS
ncbi:putative ralA-binding protein 1 isoform X3 [Apostichopus japonicus]|uniref:Putative ralA-binding protein 1 isoform X3 n=1 Tax=Stichopus japonicus TaxID=307972 RepID=A0A2G8JBP0_STIJA|nr:putative ralA-binding protein 1 isoform X3 [Apostichopus japonicus]